MWLRVCEFEWGQDSLFLASDQMLGRCRWTWTGQSVFCLSFWVAPTDGCVRAAACLCAVVLILSYGRLMVSGWRTDGSPIEDRCHRERGSGLEPSAPWTLIACGQGLNKETANESNLSLSG